MLRLIRPMVIIDEGHKAYSTKAMETIYGFNPSFVLELSGTPRDRLGDIPAGPEIVVVENDRNAAAGVLDFGTTQLGRPVDKTFTITNSGTSVLNLTGPIGISGPHAAAFELVSGPTAAAIAPGETSTFVVRLTAGHEGVKHATISLTTDDADESAVNIDVTASATRLPI